MPVAVAASRTLTPPANSRAALTRLPASARGEPLTATGTTWPLRTLRTTRILAPARATVKASGGSVVLGRAGQVLVLVGGALGAQPVAQQRQLRAVVHARQRLEQVLTRSPATVTRRRRVGEFGGHRRPPFRRARGTLQPPQPQRD